MKAWMVVDGKPQTFRTFPDIRIVEEFAHERSKDRAIGLLEGQALNIRPEELLNHEDVRGFAVYRSEDIARETANFLRTL